MVECSLFGRTREVVGEIQIMNEDKPTFPAMLIAPDPAPTQPETIEQRKSKYGRVPKIRFHDRNKQAANRVRAQRNRDGKLRYAKGSS